MATETLHYENARFAQQLYNNDTRNLKLLEDEIGVKATSREGWIKLEGDEEGIELARGLFQHLEGLLKSGAHVRNREFAYALSVMRNEGAAELHSMGQEKIKTSSKKGVVAAKTIGQRKYIEAIRDYDITFGLGPAGTGKTYLAVAMAVAALKEEKVSRIVLTRPAVEAGEALGFLPGDLYEKISPYLRPLQDALHDMMETDEITKARERGIIEIAPLAYMRGRTLNGSFVILDEAQNSTTEQMLMFLTRLGHGSKAVITGDPSQVDLPAMRKSGLLEAMKVLRRVPDIAFIEFEKRDIVRHPLVQKIIAAYEEHRAKPETAPSRVARAK